MLKGWRTVLLNLAFVSPLIIVELISYATTVDWKEFLPPHTAKALIVFLGMSNIVLRIVTTTPVGKSEPEFKDTK